jgi:rhamnopyranosyl-N-acetylglucosaminyl-diphospho-decaprenol beta-1,3/1,4-galactofuranosyltransferase
MTTIAAVVVTFNRRALLVECVDALLPQTVPLDQIFIIDNASTDGTEELVRLKGFADHARITYIRMQKNSGGSGGFYEGMRIAFEKNYDWIWVMDDDAEPEVNALETLQYGFSGQQAVASKCVTKVDTLPLPTTGPCLVRFGTIHPFPQ